jgi:hypothetical protein
MSARWVRAGFGMVWQAAGLVPAGRRRG